jgi:hypothetical protein
MKSLLKVGITLLLLALIFRHIDFGAVLATIRRINGTYLALALAVQLVSTILASYRWYMIMHVLHFGQSFAFYLKSYFKGMFFNQGLPTTLGGDAMRTLDVARVGHRKREAFYGVMIDRVAGLFALLVLNLAANLSSSELLPKPVFSTLTAITLIGIPAIIALGFAGRLHFLEKLWGANLIHEMAIRIQQVFNNISRFSAHLGLGIVIHLLSILALYFIGTGMNVGQGLLTFLVIVPPVILLTIVPISIAGWGVREGAMIGLFGMVGADKTVVLSMSILYGLSVLVTSLPGLYFYWTVQHKAQELAQ